MANHRRVQLAETGQQRTVARLFSYDQMKVSSYTRALIFIEADRPGIGLMSCVAVGMAEVSTCDQRVTPGKRIGKGEELGMFQFGRLTQCLVFRLETQLEFDLRGQTPGLDAENIPINECIARVIS